MWTPTYQVISVYTYILFRKKVESKIAQKEKNSSNSKNMKNWQHFFRNLFRAQLHQKSTFFSTETILTLLAPPQEL